MSNKIKKLLEQKWLIRSVGLVIFLFIFIFKIDLRNFFSIIWQIDARYLLLLITLFIITTPIPAWRWKYLLKKSGINISFKSSYHIHFTSLLVGLITPGRIGEIGGRISFFLGRKELFNNALSAILLEKLMDFSFLIFSACFSILFFSNRLPANVSIIAVLTIVILVIMALMITKDKFEKIIKKAIGLIVPEKFVNFRNFLAYFRNFLKNISYSDYSLFFFITALIWLVSFLFVYILAQSLNIQIPFIYLTAASAAASLISLLPVSISGIGTREATYLILLSSFNTPAEKIVILSLISNLFMIGLLTITGFICLLFKPKINL